MIDQKYLSKNANLNGLHKDLLKLLPDILKDLEAKSFQPVVMEAVRTIAQQREKVRLGYSQTMNSRHLSGKAVDIADKRYLWNDKKYSKELTLFANTMKEVAKKYNLITGTVWKSFGPWGDFAHLEVK